jgi:hypothetical protein
VQQRLNQRLLGLSRCLELYLLLGSKRVRDLQEQEVRVLVRKEVSGLMSLRLEREQSQNKLLLKLNVPQVDASEDVLRELVVVKVRVNHKVMYNEELFD